MIQKTKSKAPVATVRCAIYTRKSTDEGLDQEFNSLDAQRESGEAFIASQRGAGWVCLPEHYDDGGFTGGNMERPALQRLLADIEAGKVDCVVVYKVDRLSRSLLDFAKIMGVFDQRQIAFVSVTQQFNTATSMGRLVLNVLLSFAQFEREIIGERIRDKIAAQRRKGKWTGGTPILGYDVDRSGPSPKLVVNGAEAARVRGRWPRTCFAIRRFPGLTSPMCMCREVSGSRGTIRRAKARTSPTTRRFIRAFGWPSATWMATISGGTRPASSTKRSSKHRPLAGTGRASPCAWVIRRTSGLAGYARDYGFVAANPFGRQAFGKGPPSKVVVRAGDTLRLRYGVLLHSSPATERPDLKAAYADFVKQAGD